VLVEGFPQGDPWEPFSSTDFVTQEIAIGVDPGQYGGDARFVHAVPYSGGRDFNPIAELLSNRWRDRVPDRFHEPS
jgi:hypothetical protein